MDDNSDCPVKNSERLQIYGLKVPEWRDRKCFNDDPPTPASEKRWKRIEFLSSQDYKIFKDNRMDAGAWNGPYFEDQQPSGERKGE